MFTISRRVSLRAEGQQQLLLSKSWRRGGALQKRKRLHLQNQTIWVGVTSVGTCQGSEVSVLANQAEQVSGGVEGVVELISGGSQAWAMGARTTLPA